MTNVRAFAITDAELALHWEFWREGSQVAGYELRRVPMGKRAWFCVADEILASLYINHEKLGLLRLGAEPESDTVAEPESDTVAEPESDTVAEPVSPAAPHGR